MAVPTSLIWGVRRGGGDPFETISPLDGSVVARGDLFDDFALLGEGSLPSGVDWMAFGARFAAALAGRREAFVGALRQETGFVPRDCQELVEGAIVYAREYAAHVSTQLTEVDEGFESGGRRLRLAKAPVGTVAVILPHNAFLPLAVACLMNGLRAGNRVILRSPLHSALSASLLADVLGEFPEIARSVSVTVCAAQPFVDWFLGARFSGLLQFFGSSRRAAEMVARGFDAGKSVLIDGEGNVWVYVDRSFSAEEAVEILAGGAFRYNGQTCTSINGAVVHPESFEEVAALLAERARGLSVGPVFNERQADWCLERISQSGGQVVAGGTRQGAYLAPTVVLKPDPESELVREGLFGPALWVSAGDAAEFAALWPSNRYPLCAAVLERPARSADWLGRLPDVARLMVNGDPSVEDPFEFWGGYAPAGQNPVSAWPAKYQRTVQIDEPV